MEIAILGATLLSIFVNFNYRARVDSKPDITRLYDARNCSFNAFPAEYLPNLGEWKPQESSRAGAGGPRNLLINLLLPLLCSRRGS